MSEQVRRYEFDENGVCYHQPDGPFVSYDDYARLAAELDRVTSQNGYHYTGLAVSMLREELAHKSHDNFEIRKAHQATVQMVRDLQAKVERLTKAGNDLAKPLEVEGYVGAIKYWNAAKEGKQS